MSHRVAIFVPMLVHQAFRYEMDPNDRTRSALASHTGGSRFAFNWGLAFVKARLDERERQRERALIEGFSEREAHAIASEISVPWSLPALRREWNRCKPEVALNVSGMSARGTRAKAGLNRAILDASPARLRRQLTYKAIWKGSHLVVADRWYPSSKTCSACNAVKAKLPLAERNYNCEHCGLVIDRDLNAATNLAALAARVAASGAETENGRGGERSQVGEAGQCFPLNRQAGTVQTDKTGTAVSQGTATLTKAEDDR